MLHALLECPEYVNEITNNHTKAVSGEFCVISLFLQKLILGVMRHFERLKSEIPFKINSVHLSLPLFNFTQWKDNCASYSLLPKN